MADDDDDDSEWRKTYFLPVNQIVSFICVSCMLRMDGRLAGWLANGWKQTIDNESNSLILCFESKQILNRMESKLFAYEYPNQKIV